MFFLSFTTPHSPMPSPDEYILRTSKDGPVPSEYYFGSQIDQQIAGAIAPQEDHVNGFNNLRRAAVWSVEAMCAMRSVPWLGSSHRIIRARSDLGRWENTVIWTATDTGGDASINLPH